MLQLKNKTVSLGEDSTFKKKVIPKVSFTQGTEMQRYTNWQIKQTSHFSITFIFNCQCYCMHEM